MSENNAFFSKIRRIDFFNATGSSAINFQVNPQGAFKLIGIRMKLSAIPTTSENFVITLDNALGAAFDIEIATIDLAADGIQYLAWAPDDNIEYIMKSGDKVVITYTNTDGVTYGIEAIVERMK